MLKNKQYKLSRTHLANNFSGSYLVISKRQGREGTSNSIRNQYIKTCYLQDSISDSKNLFVPFTVHDFNKLSIFGCTHIKD